MSELEDKIKGVMATVFEVDVDSINADTSPVTLDNWDSFRHMNLIVALEEEFGVTFDADAVGEMLDFKSVSEAVQKSVK